MVYIARLREDFGKQPTEICDGRPTISSLRHRPPLAGGRRHDRRRRSTLPRRDELDAAAGSWWSAGAGGGARPWRSPREHGGWPAGGRARWKRGAVWWLWPSNWNNMRLYIYGRTGMDTARSIDECTDVRANVSGQACCVVVACDESESDPNYAIYGTCKRQLLSS